VKAEKIEARLSEKEQEIGRTGALKEKMRYLLYNGFASSMVKKERRRSENGKRKTILDPNPSDQPSSSLKEQ